MYQRTNTKNSFRKHSETSIKPRQSIALSQNFINNSEIISTVMGYVDFAKTDLIIEIGPGKGIITEAIIKPFNKVIAIEIDYSLFSELKKKYKDVENISIIHLDFLKYPLPKEKFSIVANIPFNITADIIKKITDIDSFLEVAYLITEKEAAYKFVGAPYAESPLLSHFLLIHYEVNFLMQIDKSNFTPEPGVDIGLISITKRKASIFNKHDEEQFRDMITYIFARTGATLKESLKRIFSNLQARIIIQQLSLPENISKKKVTFNDWVKVYETFVQHSPEKSKYIIRGAYEKLNQDKASLQSHKNHTKI